MIPKFNIDLLEQNIYIYTYLYNNYTLFGFILTPIDYANPQINTRIIEKYC